MPSANPNSPPETKTDANPIRSMTGFARVRRTLGDGEVVISVKTVNHRGLDMHLHLPSAADVFDNAIRGMIKQRVRRGHVDVRLVLPETLRNPNAGAINVKLLALYMEAFREASTLHGLEATVDLNAALRLPGMFGDPDSGELPAEARQVVMDGLSAALDELNTFRAREGGEIVQVLREFNAQIADAAHQIEAIRETALEAFQSRLRQRLDDLLQGVQLEPQRLAQEAAVLADRSDVGEELARLKIHSSQLGALLDAGGEAGKKLDFLLQEMNRETNTILSKTSGIGETGLKITELALGAKAAIEKLREQSLNLE